MMQRKSIASVALFDCMREWRSTALPFQERTRTVDSTG